jgi:hypothetical protein
MKRIITVMAALLALICGLAKLYVRWNPFDSEALFRYSGGITIPEIIVSILVVVISVLVLFKVRLSRLWLILLFPFALVLGVGAPILLVIAAITLIRLNSWHPAFNYEMVWGAFHFIGALAVIITIRALRPDKNKEAM